MTEPLWLIFIALLLGLIVLTLWSSRSRQHEGDEKNVALPVDEPVEEPADPADPRRKFTSPPDFD